MEITRISPQDALALIETDESHVWDHKDSRSGGRTIQKIASAFANADGGDFTVGIVDRTEQRGLDRWRGFEAQEDANFVLEADWHVPVDL